MSQLFVVSRVTQIDGVGGERTYLLQLGFLCYFIFGSFLRLFLELFRRELEQKGRLVSSRKRWRVG